jgi:hypothetical protein
MLLCMIWPNAPTAELERFLGFVRHQADMRVPYIWAAKGLELKKKDFDVQYPTMDASDCSGLVTCGIWYATRGSIDYRPSHNCNRLWQALDSVKAPLAGDLAFYGYGTNMLSHVMIVNGDGRVLGASGGGHLCTTPLKARALDARVKFKESADYRPDFRGYKRITF